MRAPLPLLLSLAPVATTLQEVWPVTPGPELWTPSGIGYTGRVKPFWFGANASGLNSERTLRLMSRHAVAGYGWQTGREETKPRTGDDLQAAAVGQAREYMDRKGNSQTMLFMYRQIQVVLRLFTPEAIAADDPEKKSMFLRSPKTGAPCREGQPWGTKDPFWNFSAPDAVDYWLDEVVGSIARQPSLQGGRGAVFFDEVDQGTCGYFCNTCRCNASLFNTAELQAASNNMLRRMVENLNAAGIIPILSLNNRLRASQDGLPGGMSLPCRLPEDDLLDALRGLQWVRFYEVWPMANWVSGRFQDSPTLWASMIQNAILEAEAGVPTVLHSGWFDGGACPAPQRTIERPGPLGGDVEFYIAAYLIVQSPGTTLAFSSDWMDKDFCWRPEFDIHFGFPLGPPVRTGAFTWERKYTKSHAIINVSSTRNGSVMLCDGLCLPDPRRVELDATLRRKRGSQEQIMHA